MRPVFKYMSAMAMAGTLALVGCSGDFTDAVIAPTEPDINTGETVRQYVTMWKFGPDGTYEFEASATGGDLYAANFTLDAGQIRTIWSQDDPSAEAVEVTITELEKPGVQVDSIIVQQFEWYGPLTITKYTGTNTVTVGSLTATYGARVKFYNSEVPHTGMQGCTPGYWRQTQHFDSWALYTPTDLFDDVFGVTYGGTLLDAVWAQGGGVDALARHSVAALLNAISADVDYPATTAEVIAAVQSAFASGDFEGTKDDFESWNEAGCELD